MHRERATHALENSSATVFIRIGVPVKHDDIVSLVLNVSLYHESTPIGCYWSHRLKLPLLAVTVPDANAAVVAIGEIEQE